MLFIYLFIIVLMYVLPVTYLFLAVLGLHCCADFSLAVECGGYCLVGVRWLLTAVVSLAEHGLWGAQSSVAVAHGLRTCSSLVLEHRFNNCDARA